MSADTIKTTFTYIIALVIIIGGGLLLVIPTQLQPSELLPFLTGAIGVVLGYVFGERTASSASASAPTVTMTPGPPPTTTISPSDGSDTPGVVG